MSEPPPHADDSRTVAARPLERWLAASPTWVLTTYAVVVSFGIYFCMYAFRKPFSAASFDGEGIWGLDLKTVFVISQIMGYALSKYVGIKICPEVGRRQRPWFLLGLILAAEAALVLFGAAPGRMKATAIFLNGLPLGMVWGMVVWYLEGRRTSEILLAGLSCSFIVSSAMVKDVGTWMMTSLEVSESWMPAVVGVIFLPAYFLFTWLLDQIPPPSAADASERHERTTMTMAERRDFALRFLPGLALILVTYFFLTAYRDFRDNYQVELFRGLGYESTPGIFSRTELFVAFGVMAVMAGLNVFRNNRIGLFMAFSVMAGGCLLIGVCTWLRQSGLIDGMTWMVVTGLGAYVAYVPFGSLLFDRIMAATKAPGTAVFAIYIADAIGYTGSVGIQIYRDALSSEAPRLVFFDAFSYVMAAIGVGCLMSAAVYFFVLRGASRQADAAEGGLAVEPAGA